MSSWCWAELMLGAHLLWAPLAVWASCTPLWKASVLAFRSALEMGPECDSVAWYRDPPLCTTLLISPRKERSKFSAYPVGLPCTPRASMRARAQALKVLESMVGSYYNGTHRDRLWNQIKKRDSWTSQRISNQRKEVKCRLGNSEHLEGGVYKYLSPCSEVTHAVRLTQKLCQYNL